MDYFRGTDETSDMVRKRFWKRIFWFIGCIILATIGFYGYLSFIIKELFLDILGR